MSKKDEALKLALEALESQIESIKQMPIARRENGMVVFAVPEAAWVGLTCCVNDMRQALAEQQSGIKQVIELYDSPEQPEQQGCMRCNTPKKCALYGCSPLTWPAEQPAPPPPECQTEAEKTAFAFGW